MFNNCTRKYIIIWILDFYLIHNNFDQVFDRKNYIILINI